MAGNRHIERRNKSLDKDDQRSRERAGSSVKGRDKKDGGRAQEFLTDMQDSKSRNI